MTLMEIIAALASNSLGACFIPVRRAKLVDPVATPRAE
jgi:hypothetical protein